MIASTAARDRYFRTAASPAWSCGCPGLRASAGNKINKLRGERRDAAQTLHKIQRDSLRGKNCARGPRHAEAPRPHRCVRRPRHVARTAVRERVVERLPRDRDPRRRSVRAQPWGTDLRGRWHRRQGRRVAGANVLPARPARPVRFHHAEAVPPCQLRKRWEAMK